METSSTLEATVTQLQRELATLRHQMGDETPVRELRRALNLATIAGTVSAPVVHSNLLRMIVESATEIIEAQAGSLFLIDERDQSLVFEVAIGQQSDVVKHFRVPLGQGIAGLVAVTGQPMAISNAQQDARHATDIAQAAGYLPDSILCVPLIANDEVIGVLELLDKVDGSSFRPRDMEMLGLFADIAAVAIQQNRTQTNLTKLVVEAIQATAPGEQALDSSIVSFLEDLEADPNHQIAKEMAALVQLIVWRGERERQACFTILKTFADYASGS
jgi:GAF domain-containing protein